MKHILLINPDENVPEWPTMPRAIEPMGLLYVAGAFGKMNIKIDLLDFQLGYGDQQTVYESVAKKKYDGVGIALASQLCLWNGLKIAQDIKNLCPAIPVFIGGVFASLNADWILKTSPAIDFVVIGEAEPFVADFVKRNGKWEKISNVLYRNAASKRELLPAELFSSPIVLPDRTLTQTVINQGEVPSIVASRGCGGGCTFCCISRYYGAKWRPRDIKDVCQELEDLVSRFAVNRFYFVDDNLFGHTTFSHTWITSFMEALIDFTPRLSFKATCRLDDLDETLIPHIKNAGFDLLKIGIETFSVESQRVYKKRISREGASKKLDLLLKHGVGVSLGFIMFDPYCCVHDLWENLDFLLHYPTCWSRHLLRSRLIVYRGTQIESRLMKDSLMTSNGILGSNWRFRDSEVARIYRCFEDLLRSHILEQELTLYNHIKLNIKAGNSLSMPRELESLLKECWIGLFKIALKNRDISYRLGQKLNHLRQFITKFCSIQN